MLGRIKDALFGSDPVDKSVEGLVNFAISRGRTLTFSYTDREGKSTVRTVTPKRIKDYEWENRRGSTRCMETYCFLDRADRTFALHRMRDVKVDAHQ